MRIEGQQRALGSWHLAKIDAAADRYYYKMNEDYYMYISESVCLWGQGDAHLEACKGEAHPCLVWPAEVLRGREM